MLRMMMMAAVLCGLSGAAVAKPALRDVPEIDNGLFAVGLANEIREICPTIAARLFRAFGYLRDLERMARDKGYTAAEIEAHLDSDAEKERLRARAATYMQAQGLAQDEAGYCALGQAEIDRNSTVGVLLKRTE